MAKKYYIDEYYETDSETLEVTLWYVVRAIEDDMAHGWYETRLDAEEAMERFT